MSATSDRHKARKRMVDRQLVARGITDEAVLEAMRTVRREAFLPDELQKFAYKDRPLPIEEGQTISQPLMVAIMAESAELTPTGRVLEVGAGSGYGAAVLGRIAGEVWSIERHERLARQAARRMDDLSFHNVHIIHGDGTLGHAAAAPFDAIVVTAGAPVVPEALIEQLADGGQLIIPVGPENRAQRLLRIRSIGDEVLEEDLGPVRFVPLVDGLVT